MNDLEVTDRLHAAARTLPSTPTLPLPDVHRRARRRRRMRGAGAAATTLAVAAAVMVVLPTAGPITSVPPAGPVGAGPAFGPVYASATLCVAEQRCGDLPEDDVLDALERLVAERHGLGIEEVVAGRLAGQPGPGGERPAQFTTPTRVVLRIGATTDADAELDRIVAVPGVGELRLGSATVEPFLALDAPERIEDSPVVSRREVTVPVDGSNGHASVTFEVELRENGSICSRDPGGHACSWPTLTDDDGRWLMSGRTTAGGPTRRESCVELGIAQHVTAVRVVDADGVSRPTVSRQPVPGLSRPTLHWACWRGSDHQGVTVQLVHADGRVSEHRLPGA